MDNIKLTGMEFFGYHGALAEENKLGQRFLVDLELYLDLHQAGAGDDLSASINYAQAYEVVKAVVEGPAFKTIEAVAEQTSEIEKQLSTAAGAENYGTQAGSSDCRDFS